MSTVDPHHHAPVEEEASLASQLPPRDDDAGRSIGVSRQPPAASRARCPSQSGGGDSSESELPDSSPASRQEQSGDEDPDQAVARAAAASLLQTPKQIDRLDLARSDEGSNVPAGPSQMGSEGTQQRDASTQGGTARLQVTWAVDELPSPTSEPVHRPITDRGAMSGSDTGAQQGDRRASSSSVSSRRRYSTSVGQPDFSKIAGSWTKRWRIKAYEKAFVMEPNVAMFQDPLGTFRNSGSPEPPGIPPLGDVSKFGPAELIMFRDKPDMVELPHASHLAAKPKRQYGAPQCVIQVDAVLGMLLIKAYRFLVLVAESDVVASLPPDCSPLEVVANQTQEEIQKALDRCTATYPPLRQIYAVKRVLLLPFHIPSGIYLGVKLNIDSLMPTSRSKRSDRANLRAGSFSRRPSRGAAQSDSDSKAAGKHRRNVSTGDARAPWTTYSSLEDLLGEIAGHVSEIERTLSKKTFFYSYDLDLTHSLQKQYFLYKETGRLALAQSIPLWNGIYGQRDPYIYPSLIDFVEPTLTWNYNLCKPFWEFGIDGNWLVPCIQGAVSSSYLNLGNSLLSMVLIGRRSGCRGGTRFFARGVDQKGHVANFCESEYLCCLTTKEAKKCQNHFQATSLEGVNGGWFSFLQLRGSIPLYWEQAAFGINPAPKVTGSKSANRRAFAAHQKLIENHYGKIHYLDLLSESKQGESKLSESLVETLVRQKESQGSNLLKDTSICEATNFTYTHWDFHQYVQANGFDAALRAFKANKETTEALEEIGYFHSVGPRLQNGVFRTNCLDCLDRTNVMQWFLCQRQLHAWLKQLPEGEWITTAQGVKYTQELYGWLIRQTDNAGAVRAFTKCSRPTKWEIPSELPDWPIRWDPDDRLRPPPPFPEAVAATRLGFLLLPDDANEEYRNYFVGGWSDDALNITYYRPQALVMMSPTGEEESTQGRLTATEPKATTGDSEQSREMISTSEGSSMKTDDTVTVPMGVPVTAPVESPGDSFFPTTLILKDSFSSLWADLGDLISVAYTGTGSVLTPLMKSGKSTILTNLTHIKRTVGRFYKQNFEDKFRQEAIDLILGLHRWSAQYDDTGTPAAMRLHGMAVAPVAEGAPSPVASEITAAQVSTALEAATAATETAPSAVTPFMERSPPDLVPTEFDLTVWVGTWNVGGGTALGTEDFGAWLLPHADKKANIYCVCLQEIVDLSRGFTILNVVDRAKEDAVIRLVRKALGDDYDLVFTRMMVGLCVTVFMETSLKAKVINGDSVDCKMGFIGGQLGNKGAVAVRFELLNRTWCFVGVHLAPDKGGDKSIERVQQIDKMLNVVFPQANTRVLAHDYLFVAGDFNFPAMAQIHEIEGWLETRNFEEFLRRDQLTWLRQRDRSTWGRLTEAPILFWPSYKYKKNTSQYDRTRPPSWCDRVLFGGSVHQLCPEVFNLVKYERVRTFMTSDHKPVYLMMRMRETREILKRPKTEVAAAKELKIGETLLDL